MSSRNSIVELHRLQTEVYPVQTADLETQVRDLEQYRASFTAEQLQAPAVWSDSSRRTMVPGPPDKAISVKADPAFPAPGRDRIQVIAVLFPSNPNQSNPPHREWHQRLKRVIRLRRAGGAA